MPSRRAIVWLTLLFSPLVAVAAEPDRSPVDLVLGPDESWLVTINQTSDTASLVRTSDGQVLHELAIGDHPTGICLLPSGHEVLIACHHSGELQRLQIVGDKLNLVSQLAVGYLPHSVVTTKDGKTAYVSLLASAEVAIVDLAKNEVTEKITVGRWPRNLALSADGNTLAVAASGDRGISVVDLPTRKQKFHETFMGLNIGQLQIGKDQQHVYTTWMTYRGFPLNISNIRQGWVLASRVGRVRLDGPARREAMALDPRGRAIADPYGFALTSDEQRMIVAAGGTHELLVYRAHDLPLKAIGSDDHVPDDVLRDRDRFDRIELGGRPQGLKIAKDDKSVYVANYFSNSVQVVDIVGKTVTKTFALGGPDKPSLARQGETIFHDARRSLDQWYSCATCHVDGGTNSIPMDTLNDNTNFTSKTVLPLYHLADTAPWTWHGWQKDLSAAMRKSLIDTMHGPVPNDDDVAAVLAYLRELKPAPNPFVAKDGQLTAAQQRGQQLFTGKVGNCIQCHTGPHFTDGQVHEVGLESSKDYYRGYNTPTLRNVYLKTTLLHDGRSATLADVLREPHSPDKVAGERALTEEEIRDLVEYLKTL
ncbi:Cytochrome c [Anatilimnocola aggregata]|uniref:Cytochrome c n=1 Tax=Anatilimnocola aggregata TaxID=2528021 RepID=A0A517YLY8_9BACT|nr:cytochrome c peroxidase [Anatilimnocola aggregata]QDU31230.1 Cytochrome c [Anatilimnocola aggregata]